jgi:LacI family transcriptional regulator
MNRKQPVTLQTIADELQLSKVTISKALHNRTDVSTQTKQKVNETAIKMGYVPNFMARNLSAGHSRTIGVVVPKIAHHFFSTVIESIYSTAYKNDYEIILTVSQENAEYEAKHIQTLLSMRVDGLMISVTEKTRNTSIFEMVRKKDVPLVFFDRTIDGLGYSSVTNDDELGATMATEYLIKKGYRKIAHFGGYHHTNIGRGRTTAFLDTMKSHNIDVPENWIIEAGFGEDDGYSSFMKLYKTGKMPEVIFAVTYPVALGIYTAAAECGINIPDDIDIVCFGDSSYQRFFSPSITYVHQPAAELGEKATELVIAEIINPEIRQEQHIVLPTELVLCGT